LKKYEAQNRCRSSKPKKSLIFFQKNLVCIGFLIYLCSSKTGQNMTIREIRRVLFETEKYTVIGADEMTNKESRDFLYAKDNQDETMNVIDNGSHLLIWK
jgi:hypothetical protein